MTVLPLFLAAHGDSARAWADAIRRCRTLELEATLDLSTDELDATLGARPDAAVMTWARGPLEASRLAERLVTHPGPSLLYPPPARPPAGRGVQLSYGWLTLSGADALAHHFGIAAPELVRLRTRGVPDRRGTGLRVALEHALALARRFGTLRLERALLEDEHHLTLTLSVGDVPWRMEVAASREAELHLVARTPAGDLTWRAEGSTETLERTGAELHALPIVPWAERCLRQLTHPIPGADLADARAIAALVDAVELALERRLPPSPPPAVAERPSPPDDEGLAPLGLAGALPAAAPLAPTPPPDPPLPLAALAYRLGLRPAMALVVDADDVARVSRLLPGTIEERPAGGRIALFAALEPAHARELADLAMHPTGPQATARTGALLGYPACCVQAFIAQVEHLDESYARYATAARTSFGPAPWPALLDDTSLPLVPHRPCTYRCERSSAQARALLGKLASEDAPLHDAIAGSIGGPVLYFDRAHLLRFRGIVRDGGIAYDEVSIPWPGSEAFARLAGVVAAGDRLLFGDSCLVVEARGEPLLTLERTDPGLGLILPFR